MKRCYWILMTFITRPMMWLLTVVAIFLAVGAPIFHSERMETYSVDVIQAGTIIDSLEELKALAANPVAGEVQIRMGRILYNLVADLSHLDDPDGDVAHFASEEMAAHYNREIANLALPDNVVALEIDLWDSKMLTRLSEIKSVKRFEIQFSHTDQSVDLSPLSNLTEIEVLDLGYLRNVDSLSPLQQLPNLHTLKIAHHGLASKKTMVEIAKLPALATLYLSDVTNFEFTLDAISELNQSTSLQTVYMPVSLQQSDAIATAQALLPNIAVRSNSFRPYRRVVFICSIYFMLCASMLGMHFSSQYQMPQAQLAPGYKNAHHVVAWAISVALILLTGVVACCWLAGAHWWPACATVGLTLVVGIRSTITNMHFLRRPSRLAHAARLCWTFGIIGLAFYIFEQPLLLESFLMGEMPLLTCVITLLALIAGVDAKRKLDAACRLRYATGTPQVISLKDVQKVSTRNTAAALKSRGGQATDLHRLKMRLSLMLGGVLLVAVLMRSTIASFLPIWNGLSLSTPMLAMAAQSLLIVSVYFVTMKWWQEMPYLARRIPRPPVRDVQIKALLIGIGNDLVMYLAPVIIAIIALALSAPFWTDGGVAMRIVASVFFASSLIISLYAIVVWALLVRNAIGAFLLGFVAVSLATMLAVVVTIIGCDLSTGLPPYRLLLTSALLIILAIVAACIARRKFQRMEWARLL